MNLDKDAGQTWFTQSIAPGFTDTPIVISQLSSHNGPDPAVLQQRNITSTSFQLKLREEEKRDNWHVEETVSFIAIEPGAGQTGTTNFLAARTGDVVTHNWHTQTFSGISFDSAPALFAHMQTTDGGDTANIRYRNLGTSSVQLQVDEEKSKDSEVGHTTENVGYLAWDISGGDPVILSANFAPQFTQSTYTMYVDENSANGTALGMVTATDANSDPITYAITAGNADGTFAINANSGEISVLDGTMLDYEAAADRTLTVEASDGSLTDSATVFISVNDVNEAPSFVPDPAENVEHYEVTLNRAFHLFGHTVLQLEASDPDDDETDLRYRIVERDDGDEGMFRISAFSGKLTLDKPAKEAQKDSYSLKIEVEDPAGNKTQVDVTVKIPVLVVVSGDRHAVEGASDKITLTFTRIAADLSDPLDVDLEVLWEAPDEEATAANIEDFVDDAARAELAAGKITIPADTEKYTLVLTAKSDEIDEGSEYFKINVKDSAAYDVPKFPVELDPFTKGTGGASLVVTDAPIVGVRGDFYAAEGDKDTVTLTFERFTSDVDDALEVNFTLLFGGDHDSYDSIDNVDELKDDLVDNAGRVKLLEGKVVIPAGAPSVSIELAADADGAVEGTQFFDVQLDGAAGYVVADYRHELANNYGKDSWNAARVKIVDKWALYGKDNADDDRKDDVDEDNPGIVLNDIAQGQLANCYCAAAMGMVVRADWRLIESRLTDNGDGSFTVKLFQANGEERTFTFDDNILHRGYDAIGLSTDVNGDKHTEIWPYLIERAWAEMQSFGGGYEAIGAGGTMTSVIKAITGQDAELVSTDEMSAAEIGAKIADSLSAGKQVGLGTLDVFENAPNPFPLPSGDQLYGNHAYVVVGAVDTNDDETVDTVILRNPWDFAEDGNPYQVSVPVEHLDKVVETLTIWDPV